MVPWIYFLSIRVHFFKRLEINILRYFSRLITLFYAFETKIWFDKSVEDYRNIEVIDLTTNASGIRTFSYELYFTSIIIQMHKSSDCGDVRWIAGRRARTNSCQFLYERSHRDFGRSDTDSV